MAALKNISKAKPASSFELVLFNTVGLGDGSLANLSWLQEFPDPVSKICWDNYITVSPTAADKMKLKEGQLLRVSAGVNAVEAPVHIQPGQSDNVLGIAMGYGRRRAGKVADGVGHRAVHMATFANGFLNYSGLAVQAEKKSGVEELACTQGHHSMEGRLM